MDVVFVDCLPFDVEPRPTNALDGLPNLTHIRCRFPHRGAGIASLLAWRIYNVCLTLLFTVASISRPGLLSVRELQLRRTLSAIKADLFIGHNIDALAPVAMAANAWNSKFAFDCMEFYSDMGGGQTAIERAAVTALEAKFLKKAALVLASSPQVADALVERYGIPRPLPLYNAPPLVRIEKREAPKREIKLYWRNSVIGFGERGLDDALVAMTCLPAHVTLHLQGRTQSDGGASVARRIADLSLSGRVRIHGPYVPHEAVQEAAKYDIGLCLERAGNKNHECTVSNKVFDYMMAGLVVVASNLPGLRQVVVEAGAGELFDSGDPLDLARRVQLLLDRPERLSAMREHARQYAESRGNQKHEMEKLHQALLPLIPEAR